MRLPTVLRKLIDWFQRSKLGRFIRIYGEREVATSAIVVAYSIMFAMFPVILAVLAIAGFILRDPEVFSGVLEQVVNALPHDAAAPVLDAIRGTREGAGTLGIIGFLGLIWAGSGLFGAISRGFNRIYQAPDRDVVRQRLMGAGMIVTFAIFLVLSLAASGLGSFAAAIARRLPAVGETLGGPLSVMISELIALALALAFFALLYRLVPNRRLTWRMVAPGTLLSASGFVVLGQVFPLYGRFVTNFNQYGAVFGLFFLLMTWFFLLAQLIFAGAVLNVVFNPGIDEQRPASAPMDQARRNVA